MTTLTPAAMLVYTTGMADRLGQIKKKAVFVGLPSEKMGGKVYGDGMTILRVGAIHEYGASFTHPGGTPYVIGSDGKAHFVSKNFTGPVRGVTKPHNITIPQRSFLRAPFRIKRKEMNEATAKQFEAVLTGKRDVDVGLGRVGVVATTISKGAFASLGYGEWKPITASTKRRKGSSRTLTDTGILKGSITHVVRGS